MFLNSLRLSFQHKQLLEHGCFENVVKFNLESVSKQGTSEVLMLVISTATFKENMDQELQVCFS